MTSPTPDISALSLSPQSQGTRDYDSFNDQQTQQQHKTFHYATSPPNPAVNQFPYPASLGPQSAKKPARAGLPSVRPCDSARRGLLHASLCLLPLPSQASLTRLCLSHRSTGWKIPHRRQQTAGLSRLPVPATCRPATGLLRLHRFRKSSNPSCTAAALATRRSTLLHQATVGTVTRSFPTRS